ncbi:hypothetical protein ACOSP7_019522 [Xanthoceras sorbifolium]
MKMGEVKQLGAFTDRGRFDMKIDAKTILDGIHLGNNIAVNGTCLTVMECDTYQMGRHFVQGHVDWKRVIVLMEPKEDSLWIKVKTTKSLLKCVMPKGYIAVDGTSLTVVNVFDDKDCFN